MPSNAIVSFRLSDDFVLTKNDTMKQILGMDVTEPGLKMLLRPGEGDLKQCPGSGRRTDEWVKGVGAGSRAQQRISRRRGFPSLGQTS